MALDFIGFGGCGAKVGCWLAAEEGLAGGNPARAIGAIVRAMVALCSVSHEAYHPVRPALRQRAAGQSGLCQLHSPVAV